MSAEFERIVAELTRDGHLPPDERAIIMRAADRLGLDRLDATAILDAQIRGVGCVVGGCPGDDSEGGRWQGEFSDDSGGCDGADEEEYEIVAMPQMDDSMSSMLKIAGLLTGATFVMVVLAKLFK